MKEKLDIRICDYEKEATNTQTYREFIKESEEYFEFKISSDLELDLLTEQEFEKYLDFLDELWCK